MKANLLEIMYAFMGLISLISAIVIIRKKDAKEKWFGGLFYFLLSIILIVGKFIPGYVVGLILVVIAFMSLFKKIIIQPLSADYESVDVGKGQTSFVLSKEGGEKRESKARLYGGFLFIPAISIGIFAFLIAYFFPKLGALVGLGIGSLISLILAMWVLKEKPVASMKEGSSLLSNIGGFVIISPLLASLGAILNVAGIGNLIASSMAQFFNSNNVFIGVVLYCVGMALFTIIMGNAFAAFAVITVGVGIPFVYSQGADPSIAGVLALIAGFCGTLMTPMAANFNVVPIAILEMKNQYSVIKAQIPIGIALLAAQIFLMYYLAF